MTPKRIEELFHQAIELGPLKWNLFLDQVCNGDEAARAELRSLLKHYEEADLLTRPAIEVFARQLARESISPGAAQDTVPGSPSKFALMPKQRLADRYEIEEGIGEGGMGQVYRAWDSQLRARVAIKVLPPDFSNRPDSRIFVIDSGAKQNFSSVCSTKTSAGSSTSVPPMGSITW